MPQEQTQQVTPQEFAAKIKTKYPAYANVPDDQLVEKITAKYPQYKSQIKTATPKETADPLRGAAQATGIRSAKPMSVAEMADTQYVKEMLKSNVDAAGFGAQMLGGGAIMKTIGKALFKPSVSMVPEVSKLLGPEGKPIVNMVEKEGASAAGKAAGLTKEGVKNILKWMNNHKVESYLIFKTAEQLGLAPEKAVKMLHVASGE